MNLVASQSDIGKIFILHVQQHSSNFTLFPRNHPIPATSTMAEGIQNANPTILNPSDLPARRPTSIVKPRADGGTGLFDDLLPSHGYGSDISHSDASSDEEDEDAIEEIDAQEIYDLIAPIMDPEHPISLGALNVVQLSDIHILPPKSASSRISTARVEFTPTITHCSLATVIGLGLRVRLEQALPPRYRVDVRVKEGSHADDRATSKQLGDKERVAAALENQNLKRVLEKMLVGCV